VERLPERRSPLAPCVSGAAGRISRAGYPVLGRGPAAFERVMKDLLAAAR
jgi:hypothetical protein